MNPHRRAAWGLVVLAFAALALTLVTREPEPEKEEAPPPPTEPEPERRGATRPVQPPDKRAVIPRPCPSEDCGEAAPPALDEAAHDAEAGSAGGEPSQDEVDTGVSDDRGIVDPTRAPTPENIQAAVRAVTPEVAACVDEWAPEWKASDPWADGTLRVEITLGPEGIREAAVLDVQNMPAGVATCFGAVIYETAWPQPDDEMKITYPFRVSVED